MLPPLLIMLSCLPYETVAQRQEWPLCHLCASHGKDWLTESRFYPPLAIWEMQGVKTVFCPQFPHLSNGNEILTLLPPWGCWSTRDDAGQSHVFWGSCGGVMPWEDAPGAGGWALAGRLGTTGAWTHQFLSLAPIFPICKNSQPRDSQDGCINSFNSRGHL